MMQKTLMRLTVGVVAGLAALSALADVKWAPSFQEAITQAKADHKLVMVEFYASWDVDGKDDQGNPLANWSGKMEKETLGDPASDPVLNKVVPVRLDVDKNGKDLAAKFHITNYPTILFLDPSENPVGIIDGFETSDEFVKHGDTFLKDYADFPGVEAKFKANPKDLDAITRLGVIYADRYEIAPAMEKLNQAEAIDRDNSTDKLSDLYSAIGDYYQNASKFTTAITYFKKSGDTSKQTDKKAYAWLSVATCYMSMDSPADPGSFDPKMLPKIKENLKAALPYLKNTLKLPNLKPEDQKIAQTDLDDINRALSNLGGD